jgi:hypothetical protein
VTKRASMRPRVADPVVTEIVRRGVMAVTEDMKTNLMRTAIELLPEFRNYWSAPADHGSTEVIAVDRIAC